MKVATLEHFTSGMNYCISIIFFFLLCHHLNEEEKAGCSALVVFFMSCYCKCSVALPHGAIW